MQSQSSKIVRKQAPILQELRKRIQDGYYSFKLPKSTELADEFNVNVKTMNKVMRRLVGLQLIERRPRGGTTVRRSAEQQFSCPVIEIIYEGSHSMEIHPYWMAVWQGLLGGFATQKISIKLNRQYTLPDKSFDLEHLQLDAVSARLVIGIHDKFFFEVLKRSKVPYLSVGDPIKDIRIHQVQMSFSSAIGKAVDTLFRNGFGEIAFVGRIYSNSDSGELEKYHAWRNAMIRHRSISDNLCEHAHLYENAAYQATLNLLGRKVPQVLMIASDTQIPEVYRAMRQMNVSIPVIGCDGIPLECDLEQHRPRPIQAPLFAVGQYAAGSIVKAIEGGKKPKSAVIEAKYYQREMMKIVKDVLSGKAQSWHSR